MITDAGGTPLVVQTTPANVRDDRPAPRMVGVMLAVRRPRGRPRRKPGELLGDWAYGSGWLIAPRGSPHGSGLGKRYYVVEQTLAAFGNSRRIKFCYEATGTHFQGFHDLAAALICFRRWRKIIDGL